jgi:aerobic-type carbon monoxide dehydrogenase small subunit (CoxS/CutS family)
MVRLFPCDIVCCKVCVVLVDGANVSSLGVCSRRYGDRYFAVGLFVKKNGRI